MAIKLKPLNEQVMVITGASSGIGLATAEAAAEAGAKLVLSARSGETLAKKLEGMQAGRQQYDEPPRDPEGTLDKPGEAGQVSGQTRGTGPARNGARPNAR